MFAGNFQDQIVDVQNWPCDVVQLSDFVIEPIPDFLSTVETGTQGVESADHMEEPQQTIVHCLPLPSFPEPPDLDLTFLLGSNLGVLPLPQKLKWIDHAVKRLDYLCDLYKYRENFQKLISSWKENSLS